MAHLALNRSPPVGLGRPVAGNLDALGRGRVRNDAGKDTPIRHGLMKHVHQRRLNLERVQDEETR